MKPSIFGIVAAAILIAVAALSLGIAQAGGDQSLRPVWNIDEQIETGNLPEPAMERPSQQEFVPEANYSGTDWQLGGPVETGSVTEMSGVTDLDHTDIPREGNVYRYWGADNPSN